MKQELYLIAKSRLKNEDDVCDAMQETMLSSYKNIRKVKNNQYFKSWVIKNLINKCNTIYRKKQKINLFLEENEMNKYIESPNTFENISNISFQELISKLDRETKIIFTLFYSSDYTIKEISKLLKINESTIRTKMMRAKRKIKEDWEEGLKK